MERAVDRRKEKEYIKDYVFFRSLIFSLAIFGENLRYCYSLGIVVVWHRCCAKTLTFCNISCYLKIFMWNLFTTTRANQGRPFKMDFFFFQNYAPFLTWT